MKCIVVVSPADWAEGGLLLSGLLASVASLQYSLCLIGTSAAFLVPKKCSMTSTFLFGAEIGCIVLDKQSASRKQTNLSTGNGSNEQSPVDQPVQNTRASSLSSCLFRSAVV